MNIEELKTKIDESYKVRQYPCHTNRASEMGHPCPRYLYYCRMNWQDKALPDARLLKIFEEGNVHEVAVLKRLAEAGIKVTEQQRDFQWREYQITGHVDGKVEGAPIEIKSMSDFSFKAVNAITDMFGSRYLYMRKYLEQLNLYMLMSEAPEGAFILKNKQTGEIKILGMKLDYGLGEATITKARIVNEAVEKQEPPERIEYAESVCGECAFKHICLPDIDFGAGAELVVDDELELALVRRAELQSAAKEFEQLDKEIKDRCKGRGNILCGNYSITSKETPRKGYTVPDTTVWTVKIQEVKKDGQ